MMNFNLGNFGSRLSIDDLNKAREISLAGTAPAAAPPVQQPAPVVEVPQATDDEVPGAKTYNDKALTNMYNSMGDQHGSNEDMGNPSRDPAETEEANMKRNRLKTIVAAYFTGGASLGGMMGGMGSGASAGGGGMSGMLGGLLGGMGGKGK